MVFQIGAENQSRTRPGAPCPFRRLVASRMGGSQLLKPAATSKATQKLAFESASASARFSIADAGLEAAVTRLAARADQLGGQSAQILFPPGSRR
jgi:hypothetical protein